MCLSWRGCASGALAVLVLAGCGEGPGTVDEAAPHVSNVAQVTQAAQSPDASANATAASQPTAEAAAGSNSGPVEPLAESCTVADYEDNDMYASTDECAFISIELTVTPGLAVVYRETSWAWADPVFEVNDWYDFYGVGSPQEVVDAANAELEETTAASGDVGVPLSDGTSIADYFAPEELLLSIVLDGEVFVQQTSPMEFPYFFVTLGASSMDDDVFTLDFMWPGEGVDELVMRVPGGVVEADGVVEGDTVTWNISEEAMHVAFTGVSAEGRESLESLWGIAG